MKIAYILHNHNIDGSFISWKNLVTSMITKDYKIIVICPKELSYKKDFLDYVQEKQIVVYYANIYYSFVGKSKFIKNWKTKFKWYIKYIFALKNKYQSFVELLSILKKERPSIVHTNVGIVHEGFLAAKYLKIPHVWHLREYQDKDWGYYIYPSKFIFSRLLRGSYVISITKDILSYFHLDNYVNAKLIYNGICKKDDIAFTIPKDNYFISACTIAYNKGIHESIYAFERFHSSHNEYKFYIIGSSDGEYALSLKKYVEEHNLKDVVIFMGYQPQYIVYKYLKKAKALIVSSYQEGFGRMTAEAAFNGALIIGRNTAGTKEILDSIGGVPFEGGYINLLEKMNYVHNMTEVQYQEITINAQKIALEKYSIESNVKKIEELYKKIINNGNKTT